jgi:hypothetical protein
MGNKIDDLEDPSFGDNRNGDFDKRRGYSGVAINTKVSKTKAKKIRLQPMKLPLNVTSIKTP